MHCAIYKGPRKPESFLYVEKADDFARVPKALLTMFGELELVMELDLGSRSKLVNADLEEVQRLLVEQGFYLQMPPDKDAPRI
ncbi:YcgL domain-containing protein [Sulfuriflexus mobilis]|uniref:YcgL domain-containing protein n=1 Tax=Sulfuriflexus mobilis TaxID=1811807 RepID=UPI000F83A9C0|nr:YcgL domain-containing protein [Sulfuriflexus mobilis]